MDQGTTERLYGNYRAQVIDNRDEQQFGRVLVWIPDLMENVDPDEGIWARPANNPIGGRNKQGDSDHHYMGCSYIPKKGAWTWIFFEAGNINRPYYFGALDLENTKVLPENQVGDEYEHKWTLLKTHEGRAIVISDDPDDERTEITEKKHELGGLFSKPTGDTDSVYPITGNMNTLLIDERTKYEKILIKSRKGDYIKINIKDQKIEIYTKDEIHMKTDSNFFLTADDDINIRSLTGNVNIEAGDHINIKADDNIYIEAEDDLNLLSDTADVNIQAEDYINILSDTEDINIQARDHINILTDLGDVNIQAEDNINIKADDDIRMEGEKISITADDDMHIYSKDTLNLLADRFLYLEALIDIDSDDNKPSFTLTSPGDLPDDAGEADDADDADSAEEADPNGDRTP